MKAANSLCYEAQILGGSYVKLAVQILAGCVAAALVLVLVASGYLAFSAQVSSDGVPTVAGHKVLAVVSGSMEPAIRTGDIIVVKPVADPLEEVNEGTVITYWAAGREDVLITHRVKKTVLVDGHPMGYVTQGDANEVPDRALIAPDQVVGVYHSRVPYVGYVTAFLLRALGIVALTG